MKKILEIKNLNKKYHQKTGEIEAIKNVSLTINEGEFIAIVGPSGCGKSTILSIICNIEKKSNGIIKFIKKDFKIGYMLQDDTLFPWLTVLDNCLLGLEINKKLTKENKEKIISLLTTYGLSDFIYCYPKTLSGGMRQRVALIRTLALNPDILLLDEPFSALDYQTRLAVSDDVYKIIKKENKTTIMVTHDIAEAISMADKIIVLSKRPATIKNIYNINLSNKSNPIENRKAKEFAFYYSQIWKDLDIHV
ncbi:MAG: ABC transporter ATP-binding protein [Bacilli bacterium]|jgi:NitT/TauT family transport system ATP-binding protein|nr:ABC transporter ATP-binding protein [Bacilli bacterium]